MGDFVICVRNLESKESRAKYTAPTLREAVGTLKGLSGLNREHVYSTKGTLSVGGRTFPITVDSVGGSAVLTIHDGTANIAIMSDGRSDERLMFDLLAMLPNMTTVGEGEPEKQST